MHLRFTHVVAWVNNSLFLYCWIFPCMAIPQFPIHQYKYLCIVSNFSVQFSRSVVSDSWRPHGPQHARPPCSSPTPGVYSNSCPLSQWCHPTISSSVISFSSCPQSFPASGPFQMSQFFTSGIGGVYFLHQSILHQRYTFFTKVLKIINKVAINMHVQIFLCVNINFYS